MNVDGNRDLPPCLLESGEAAGKLMRPPQGGSVNSGLGVEGWELDALLGREWLTANGIGGYACSTLPGLNTRKYHGLLVAAMSPPVRRMVLLSRVEESLWHGGQRFALDCNEYPGVIYPQGQRHLREFHPGKSPRWVYGEDGWRIQKQLMLLPGSNTVVLTYKLLAGDSIDLQLRPLLALRPIHDLSYQFNGRLETEDRSENHHWVAPTSRTPEAFFAHNGRFTPCANWYLNQIYRREQQRGYAGLEDLWTPGAVRFQLTAGHEAEFVCSTDPIELDKLEHLPDRAKAAVSGDATLRMLREAAEQFVVAGANQATAIIAGYPWLGFRSREALIGFTGLFLIPGRMDEARSLLLFLASHVRNGIMPSEFPEDGGEPVYRGADISLWFANAVWDYARYGGSDDATVGRLLDSILGVISQYRAGTDLGVKVGADGLLSSQAPGMATSWMDATVGEWVVTPRAGRPVELNALWYNAVCVAVALCERLGTHENVRGLKDLAESISRAFNEQFWNESGKCCFDVCSDDAPDPSVRPNQLLAASLPFPVLRADRHEAVLKKVTEQLLVPKGVRSLSPEHPGYRPHYAGNVQSRDGAHHNGSAFPWLLGPYAQLLLRVRGQNSTSRAAVHKILEPCLQFAMDAGLRQIPELFDGQSPHAAGGAIASAASVGEFLRCYVEDVLGHSPTAPDVRPTRAKRKPRTEAGAAKPARPSRDTSLRSARDI
jgi:predicted glycogen debranching enzyme